MLELLEELDELELLDDELELVPEELLLDELELLEELLEELDEELLDEELPQLLTTPPGPLFWLSQVARPIQLWLFSQPHPEVF